MPWNTRIGGVAPVIASLVQIGVTDATVSNLDCHFSCIEPLPLKRQYERTYLKLASEFCSEDSP